MMQADLQAIERASKRAARVSAIGGLIVLGSIIYSFIHITTIEKEVQAKKAEIHALNNEVTALQAQIPQLTHQVQDLGQTQDGILDFLTTVTDSKSINILDPDVDWASVKQSIEKMPHGMRKQTLLNAILLAWKDIPFTLGGKSVTAGFDSPSFMAFVLSKSKVPVERTPGVRLSDSLMQQFHQVDQPRPGDLVFYKGQVGSFGLIYLADGKPGSAGVGVGTLQAASPLQIMSLDNVNTRYFPRIGYFRVNYPDELE